MSVFSTINNVTSLNAQSQLNRTQRSLAGAVGRLTSGLRINQSGDDAAGLAIANKFRSDIAILNQGVRNANDGLSTLQIIDGGLNNISNLLDRAATLSAQSASDTFSGNRDTLQSEFSKVLSEITREAQNIGLVQNGANNRALTTVIGGGSDSFAASNSNNGVQIDLSGASNRVDATSLGLSSLNIGALTGNVTGLGGIDFTATSATLSAAETLTFQRVGATGTLQSFTVALTSGQTANSVLAQLQADTNLKDAGITAGLSGTQLEFKSANFFTVVSDRGNANQSGIGTFTQISSAANAASLVAVAAGAGSTQTLDFTVGASGTITRVSFTTTTSASTNAANIVAAVNNNATLRDAGIYALTTSDTNDTYVFIASTKNQFALNVENAITGSANNATSEAGVIDVVAGSGVGGAAGAKAALDALKAANGILGQAQGAVGAGQNRLTQAIDLANAQITNFQAAESRVRDADIASEASNLARLQVLQQAGVAALSQANISIQGIISLLR
jgi:flagellin